MNTECKYTSDNLTIEVNAEQKFLYANWIGFQTVDNVKQGAEIILEVFKSNKCALVLNDNRNVSGPFQGATEWIAQYWFPQLFAAGLKKFALLPSPSLFSQLSANEAIKGTDKKDESIRTFAQEQEGRQWLLS